MFDVTRAGQQHVPMLGPQQQQRRQQQQQRVRRRLQQQHDHNAESTASQQQQQQQQQGIDPIQPVSVAGGSHAAAAAAAAAEPSPNQQPSQQQQQGSDPTQLVSRQALASLPEAADMARVLGNNALFEQSYTAAIRHFSDAIAAAPHAAGLRTQRALALLKRGWEGDAAYALRDCETAIALVTQQQQQQHLLPPGGGSNGGGSSGGGSNGGSSVEQQARLRLVHALKQLGQVKVRGGGTGWGREKRHDCLCMCLTHEFVCGGVYVVQRLVCMCSTCGAGMDNWVSMCGVVVGLRLVHALKQLGQV